MSLENILKALEASMKGELDKTDQKLLEKRDVQNTLTTFFAEQEARPELVAQIRSQSLMYEYLQLSLEEREKLEKFREGHPHYLEGNGEECKGKSIQFTLPEKTESFSRKNRYVQQLLNIFDFYLKNRSEGVVFNTKYLTDNEALNKEFGSLGQRLYVNARNHFKDKGGRGKFIALAAEMNQEIMKYMTSKEVLKIDGPKQLLRIFDFYLKNRKEYDVFNLLYLQKDVALKEELGSLGNRLFLKACRSLKDEGGIDTIIALATKVNPEVKKYTTFKEVIKVDGPKQLLRMFDFYLKNRKGDDVFNSIFLTGNEALKEEFGSLGQKLYSNSLRHLKREGGIRFQVKLAAQERPEILEHWKYDERKGGRRK